MTARVLESSEVHKALIRQTVTCVVGTPAPAGRGDGRHAGDACADRDLELRHNNSLDQVYGISIILKLVFQNLRLTLSD